MSWYEETLHDDLREKLRVSRVLYEGNTGLQHLVIFENPSLGRVMALDGVIQTTEADEYAYHEMLAHVPILAHGRVRRVLIIGGGDGGCLEEVLKHPIDRATMVEIDGTVIALAREHLSAICGAAFDDPRADLVVGDGAKFVQETDDRFDVIIVDSPDPIGPAEVLFGNDFYAGCRRCLAEGGILVTQNGVPFVQPDELRMSHARLSAIFRDVAFYLTVVPTYHGGHMTLGWASDMPAHRAVPLGTLEERHRSSGIETRYYNAEVHRAAFALPNFIRGMLATP
ncbi:MAG: polyamine aminopropyltransferase [Alphaproteobacteria bacterium]|nr:polyamine aminopropyltransferase [Alphaproteobacteria bacterium]